jgi:hypothetical protein
MAIVYGVLGESIGTPVDPSLFWLENIFKPVLPFVQDLL